MSGRSPWMRDKHEHTAHNRNCVKRNGVHEAVCAAGWRWPFFTQQRFVHSHGRRKLRSKRCSPDHIQYTSSNSIHLNERANFHHTMCIISMWSDRQLLCECVGLPNTLNIVYGGPFMLWIFDNNKNNNPNTHTHTQLSVTHVLGTHAIVSINSIIFRIALYRGFRRLH